MKNKSQSFYDWVFNPSKDDELIANTFRRTVRYAFEHELVLDIMDVGAPDKDSLEWKLAVLLFHKRITPEGNKVYVYRNGELYPLPEGLPHLQHLLHESERNTTKAYGILSHEFEGVVRGLVERDVVGVIQQIPNLFGELEERKHRINLKAMDKLEGESHLIPELGWHQTDIHRVRLLQDFFQQQNAAFESGGEFFFEKAITYPFHQRIREKAFICNGPGGVGKTLMTKVAAKLYGSKGQVGSEPTFTGQDKNRITREFIGKKFIIYNDIESPSTQLMTWLKPMLTGNMTIKGEGGFERSVPCEAVFFLETNFKPQFLGGNQDIRRFVVRTAKQNYKLLDHMKSDDLDIIEYEVTAADVATYLLMCNHYINMHAGGWNHFEDRPLPVADFIEIAQEYFSTYPSNITKGILTAYANQNKLTKIELETLKELNEEGRLVLVGEEKRQEMEEEAWCEQAEEELFEEDVLFKLEICGESSYEDDVRRQASASVPLSSMQEVASYEPEREGEINDQEDVLGTLQVLLPTDTGTQEAGQSESQGTVQALQEQSGVGQDSGRDEGYLYDF